MSDSNNDDYKLNRRDVSTAFSGAAKGYDAVSLLQQTVADRLIESFELIKINPACILDLGSGTGYGSKQLKKRFRKSRFFQCDISDKMLNVARQKSKSLFSKNHFFCADAGKIPVIDNQFDLVFSNLMLQWCGDLDAVFNEVRRVLKPDGVFLFSSFGPDTLKELRESWRQVDDVIHVNAFVDMHDIGDALMRNGLSEPVLSVEHLVLTYDECRELMRELKNIGANNINKGRRKTLTGKDRLQQFIKQYDLFRKEGKLPATYEVVYGHAWRPQQAKHDIAIGNSQTISLEKMKQDLKARNSGS